MHLNKIIKICLAFILLSRISYGQHYTDWTGFEFVKHYKPVLSSFVFNELMKDYTINLSEYFTDAEKLPEDCTEEADFYRTWATSLPPAEWDFILLEPGGILTIKKGYRWDGATNVASDKAYNHRSSLVHDALYDLMRMHYLEPDLFESGDPSETDNAGDYNRKMADMLYYMIAIEDGEPVDRAESDFFWIRTAGWIGTTTDFQLKSWKFHASELRAYSSDHKITLEWRKNDACLQNPDPSAQNGYTILRNGVVYDAVDASTLSYNDLNVINGELYSYQLVPKENSEDIYDWTNVEFAVPNGEAGNAFKLDGNDDYFASNTVCNDLCYNSGINSLSYPFNFTLEAWVFPEEKSGKNAIMAFNTITGDECIGLLYDGDNQKFCYFDASIGYIFSNHIFPENELYRVAMTFDSLQNATLYINGIAEATFITQIRPSHGGRFSIGQEWDRDATSQFFKGSIDEVRIWQRARSQDEIIHDLYTPLKGNETDLISLWHFDEPSGTYSVSYWGNVPIENTVKAYDSSANGNDGIIIGHTDPLLINGTDQPERFLLFQNYPNPFKAKTKIKFNLSGRGRVHLAIYNAEGREIEVLKNETLPEGNYEISWPVVGLPDGIYYCRLQTSEYATITKMILKK
jgi:hypothetical protein